MTATPTPDKQPMVPAIGRVPGVRALAPVFISYRTSDGSRLAAALAWALRATGVPVWHDVTDLPPGDTTRRLQEALTSGLSGAVLIVSPDIRLLRCHTRDRTPRPASPRARPRVHLRHRQRHPSAGRPEPRH